MLNKSDGSAKVAIIVVVLLIVVAAVIFIVAERPVNTEGVNQPISDVSKTDKVNLMADEISSGSDGIGNEMAEENSSITVGDDVTSGDMMAEDNVIPEVKTFDISGVNFAFSLKEIRVKQGDKVKVVLTSDDGFHDWVVDEFNAATSRVNTGQTAEVEFVADKKGTFEYYCSVGQHRQFGMVGKLIVE